MDSAPWTFEFLKNPRVEKQEVDPFSNILSKKKALLALVVVGVAGDKEMSVVDEPDDEEPEVVGRELEVPWRHRHCSGGKNCNRGRRGSGRNLAFVIHTYYADDRVMVIDRCMA